jgi:hypothetical protein
MPVEQVTIALDTKTIIDTQKVYGSSSPITNSGCEVQYIKEDFYCSFTNQQSQIDSLVADGYTLTFGDSCTQVYEKPDPVIENIANDDFVEVAQGQAVSFNVITNDVSGTSQALSIHSFTQPLYGTLTKVNSTTFRYTHNGTDNFADTFNYTATNDNGETNIATVSISISFELAWRPIAPTCLT